MAAGIRVLAAAQECVVRSFGHGMGTFVPWRTRGPRGAREALRRAQGRPAHLGREGDDGVRACDAGVLARACGRPGAAAVNIGILLLAHGKAMRT